MSIYDERNLPEALGDGTDGYNDEPHIEIDEKEEDDTPDTGEVYELPTDIHDRNRLWSILSLIAGIISIVLSPIIAIISIVTSVAGISLASYSRKRFGFFTRMTLVGMMISMIGAVAGVSFALAGAFGLI